MTSFALTAAYAGVFIVVLGCRLPAQELVVEDETAVVGRLEALMKWANEQGLYQQRDEVAGSILALESENAAARKLLRFQKQKDGTWRQTPGYKAPSNRSNKGLEEFEKRRKQALEPWLSQAVSAFEREQESMTPAQRTTRLAKLARLQPDHEGARAAMGEQRDGAT